MKALTVSERKNSLSQFTLIHRVPPFMLLPSWDYRGKQNVASTIVGSPHEVPGFPAVFFCSPQLTLHSLALNRPTDVSDARLFMTNSGPSWQWVQGCGSPAGTPPQSPEDHWGLFPLSNCGSFTLCKETQNKPVGSSGLSPHFSTPVLLWVLFPPLWNGDSTQFLKVIDIMDIEVSLLLFSHWVMSDSLRPHGLQHARPSCLSPSPGVCPRWSKLVSVSRSVVPDSLRPHGLQSTRLFCPWDFPGKDTGVGCHFLLQGIFQPRNRTQVSCTTGRFFLK